MRAPAETARSSTPDGYVLIGDLGIIDEDGCACPAVHEACVIGVPHDIMGEQVCACPVPVQGAVIAGARRQISRVRRWPTTGSQISCASDVFPMTGSGKTERRELDRMLRLELTTTGR